MDSLPPPPPPLAAPQVDRYGFAPSDIYPRGKHEAELCEKASFVDWQYLLGLGVLDAGAILFGSGAIGIGSHGFEWTPGQDASSSTRTNGSDIKSSGSEAVRYTGPAMIGLTWGATVGAGWLVLPKCSMHWVGESPREGGVRQVWPLALSFAILGGVTAPIVNRIADGSEPQAWSNTERVMHVVTAGVFGFAGAFVPYLLPPKTWAAAREIERLRVNASAEGAFVGYTGTF